MPASLGRAQISAQGTAVTGEGRAGATFSYDVFHSFNKPPITAFNPLLGVIGDVDRSAGRAGAVAAAPWIAHAPVRILDSRGVVSGLTRQLSSLLALAQ